MPARPLPEHPNLDQLKHQAKDLIKAHAACSAEAAQRLREFHPSFKTASDAEIFAAHLSLSDAQLAIAGEHGFASWPRLKHFVETPAAASRLSLPHHERIEDPAFRHAVTMLDAGDSAGLREYLRLHPGLIRQKVVFEGGNYFRNPSLLEFIAENPVRHNRMTENVLAIAGVLLGAGPGQESKDEALMLVATGSVGREAGKQIALIDQLCEAGADPSTALRPAAVCGELASVAALLRWGAPLDLPVAAALGDADACARLLPTADATVRHLALAYASQHGRVPVVRLLLDDGEDPSRYNPTGGHSHCTPLHQAALQGNLELAQLLFERGARLDIKDVLWKATAADWARHQGKTEMERYLRGLEARDKPAQPPSSAESS